MVLLRTRRDITHTWNWCVAAHEKWYTPNDRHWTWQTKTNNKKQLWTMIHEQLVSMCGFNQSWCEFTYKAGLRDMLDVWYTQQIFTWLGSWKLGFQMFHKFPKHFENMNEQWCMDNTVKFTFTFSNLVLCGCWIKPGVLITFLFKPGSKPEASVMSFLH